MQLGFIELEVSDLAAWDTFLTRVLGLQSVGDHRYRMDQHAWRFQLREGPADDLSAMGWELSPEALEATCQRLTEAGHPPRPADPEARGAAQRFGLEDPAGIPLELVTGLARSDTPFHSDVLLGDFVADDQGLGHLVITAHDKRQSAHFYTELLGFRLSDHIVTEFFGHAVDLSFFHVNARHHSLAFGGPQRKRLNHFMIEARTMDDVGLCYDRTIRAGHRIVNTLGRHPNDRMFSFYAKTPSRFNFEFGWGGREVDDATWQPTTYDRISEWGHHPPTVVFGRER